MLLALHAAAVFQEALSLPPGLTWQQMLIMQIPSILGSVVTLAGIALAGWKLHKGQMDGAAKADTNAIAASDQLENAVNKTVAATTVVSHQVADTHRVTENKLDEVHALVNNEHGVSLRLAATLAQRIADLTADPVDKDAARQAKDAADLHDQRQLEADDKRALQARAKTITAPLPATAPLPVMPTASLDDLER